MKIISNIKIGLFFILIGLGIKTSTAHAEESGIKFFENLKQFCGKQMTGVTQFPDDPNHDFAGKALILNFNQCEDKEIRVPFAVGEDHSRTWIITLVDGKVRLKHDHRHKDGSPDEITMYGGYANDKGDALEQYFPADEHTSKLIPAAKTNVWSLTINPKTQTLTYYLERHQKLRYKAEFKIKN